jgi:AraC-like DNA-binding protein
MEIAQGGGMHVFTTVGLPTVRAKMDYLKGVMSSVFAPLDVVPDDPDLFDNHIVSTSLGSLSLANAHSYPAHIIRRRPHAAGTPRHLFFLHMQLQGKVQAMQDGREGLLGPGDMVLCDAAAPYDLGLIGENRTLILGIPADELTRRVPAPYGLLGRQLPGSAGPLRMVRGLLGELWEQVEKGAPLPQEAGERLAATLLDLFATACHLNFGTVSAEGTLADGHRARIRRLIEQRLFDPDLSVPAIAQALGLSERYLRLLAAGEGEAVSAYILRRRLAECARRLRDPLHANRTVTELAFACGFNDASHFSRAFKARYGMAPRDYRAEG